MQIQRWAISDLFYDMTPGGHYLSFKNKVKVNVVRGRASSVKYNFNFYKISLIFSDICIHFPKIFTKDIQPFCLEIFIAQSFAGICNSLLHIFIINIFL